MLQPEINYTVRGLSPEVLELIKPFLEPPADYDYEKDEGWIGFEDLSALIALAETQIALKRATDGQTS